MTRRKRPAAFQPETRSTDGRYIGWMRRNTRSSAGRAASQQMHGQPALLSSWTNLERGTVLDARMQTEDYRDVSVQRGTYAHLLVIRDQQRMHGHITVQGSRRFQMRRDMIGQADEGAQTRPSSLQLSTLD